MYLLNSSIDELQFCLEQVNKDYNDNIIFKRLEQRGNKILFTLRVKDSKGKGARRSSKDRRIISACWHVHGELFDTILFYNEKAIIEISWTGYNVYKDSDGKVKNNWQDWNAGSKFHPVFMSELCDCSTFFIP